MSKSTETYESVVAAWAAVGESHDLDYQVFAPPPAKSRLGRFGQRASGKSAGPRLGGSRVGHVLSGTIGNVDVAVLAGNHVTQGSDAVNVTKVTHYHATAPWMLTCLRAGIRKLGGKDPLRYAAGGSPDWVWLELDDNGSRDLLVRTNNASSTRMWLDAKRTEVLRVAVSDEQDVRLIDGSAQLTTAGIEAHANILSGRLEALYELVVRLE
jgi:hypothetical protein